MTSNRLSELVHLKYYKNIELPIISHEDKELTRLILSNSHTFRVGLGINPIHLTKKLTNINTKNTNMVSTLLGLVIQLETMWIIVFHVRKQSAKH